MLTFIAASACCELFQFEFRQADNTGVASIIPGSTKCGVAQPDNNWIGIKTKDLRILTP